METDHNLMTRDDLIFCLDDLSNKYQIKNHPFFQKIINKTIPKEMIAKILAPFYYVIVYWTFILLNFHKKLKTNMDYESADLLYENISSNELGFDKENNLNPEAIHTSIYINFLHSLGFSEEIKLTDPIKEFRDKLEQCLDDSSGKYACILGGIVYFYINIGDILCQKLLENYNVKQNYYKPSMMSDKKYAMDLFQIAINQETTIFDMKNSIKLGFDLLWRIYLELLQSF